VQQKLNSPGPELPDGLEKKLWPTSNGVNPEERPSALNGYGDRPTTSNGVNRPGKRKKKRKGPAAPTTNGRYHFEPNGRS
jgi:hypothetical protein